MTSHSFPGLGANDKMSTATGESAPVASMIGAAHRALQETRNRMGANASLLEHLPDDKIRTTIFEDKKNQRPNALQLRMYFGQIKEGKDKGLEVWILLHKAQTAGHSPQQQFNLFDRHGEIVKHLNTEDAIQLSTYANAFKCLKESGSVARDRLRAVIKYYFMIKKVELPLPWPINTAFIEHLTAACRVARSFATKTANAKKLEQQRKAVSNAMPKTITPVLDTRIETRLPPAFSATTVKNAKPPMRAIRTPNQQYLSPLALPRAPIITDTRETVAPDIVQEDQTARKEGSVPMYMEASHSEAPADDPPRTEDSVDFVSSYRKILADDDVHAQKVKANNARRKTVENQKLALEDEMKALEAEAQELEADKKQRGLVKKRLRASLADKERALLELGVEMGERGPKRPKIAPGSDSRSRSKSAAVEEEV